jgi:hypothetical protein
MDGTAKAAGSARCREQNKSTSRRPGDSMFMGALAQCLVFFVVSNGLSLLLCFLVPRGTRQGAHVLRSRSVRSLEHTYASCDRVLPDAFQLINLAALAVHVGRDLPVGTRHLSCVCQAIRVHSWEVGGHLQGRYAYTRIHVSHEQRAAPVRKLNHRLVGGSCGQKSRTPEGRTSRTACSCRSRSIVDAGLQGCT